ncbi:T9SS type A sorting domain-containing protein [Hymenobacter tibetensis]|uniref:T9SS type A sorting domain-containing protein n=1 Tax=Hymenobacter tibetensis TaxID=497967 RepID=A0ABY4CW21_9BACT|nr:SBBP repeat-containing protein [Hymenobacter tibetensis]UOG73184.1 T9SS type A sorting domain-containing protein [Hymenobacter tibetensis]
MRRAYTRLLLLAAGLLVQVSAVRAQAVPTHQAQQPMPALPQEPSPFKELAVRRASAGNTPAGLIQRHPVARPGAMQATRAEEARDQARTTETVREAWVARYHAPGSDNNTFKDMAVDAAGNVYVTGNSGAYADYVTVKYSPSGQQLWTVRYNATVGMSTPNSNNQATAIALDAAGNVYVTGTSIIYGPGDLGGRNYDYATVKYSPSGQQLWVARYSGLGDGRGALDAPAGLAVDAAGNVVVAGTSTFSPPNEPRTFFRNYATVKYDGATGQQLWSTLDSVAGRNSDSATDLALDAAGDVYVTGTSGASGVRYFTCRYASATGTQVWASFYGGPVNNSTATHIAVDAGSNVYVTGISSGSNNPDYATVKYAPSGQQLWVATYNGPSNNSDLPTGLAVDAAGSVYVTGYSGTSVSQVYNAATLKYSASGQQLWEARYNKAGSTYDQANDLALDGAGNVYVTGYSFSNGQSDYASLKYNGATGQQLWEASYNGPSGNNDYASRIALDAVGNVYVAGSSYNTSQQSNSDYAIVKYEPSNLPPLWEARFTGTGTSDEVASDVVTDAAGNVYVTGYAYNGRNYDYATVKYSAAGQQLWKATYNGPANGDEIPTALAVDAAGNVVVTGYSLGNGSRYDYITVKYSPSGQELWSARYSGLGQGNKYAFALAVDAAGNVFVTGEAAGIDASPRGSIEYLTLKYSASGQQVWAQRYSGYPYSTSGATAITVDAAGNAYVTGYSFYQSSLDYATVKYSASGQQLWVARYDGLSPSSSRKEDIATALAVDAAGNVYVTGSSESESDASKYDYATLKYSPSGEQLWVARYNGPGNSYDLSTDLALDAAGNAYVSGTSYTGSGWDYMTLKYSASGQQLWEARYDGPDSSYDEAAALALDAAGNAYVTGLSYNSDGTSDYATVKYAAASGRQLWQARYNGSGNSYDEPAAIAVDASNHVYVTGFSLGGSTGYDFATLKYGSVGLSTRPMALAATPPTSAPLVVATARKRAQDLSVYPNPTVGAASVSFRPVQDGAAQVLVYNQLGRQVTSLYEGVVHKGQRYTLALDGQHLAPGLYTCSLLVNGQRETVRLVVAH